mgnify:CR=1 FL=1
MTFAPQPKPRPKALEKADRVKATAKTDSSENATVRRRSRGRCEVRQVITGCGPFQCAHTATEIHHLLGGRGRRNIGRSLLAAHKLHVCRACHGDITRHVLQASGADRDRAASVVYIRRT